MDDADATAERRERGKQPLSALAAYVRAELENRGWTELVLARRAKIPPATLSNLLNKPDALPNLRTLASLASGLDVPLGRLITLCGFDLGDPSADTLAELEAILPEITFLRTALSQLPKSQRQQLLAFVQGFMAAQPARQ